jgi:hypothetical protein
VLSAVPTQPASSAHHGVELQRKKERKLKAKERKQKNKRKRCNRREEELVLDRREKKEKWER